MKRQRIILISLLILVILVSGGFYLKHLIAEQQEKADDQLVLDLNNEADDYLSKVIKAIETGDSDEICAMAGGNPADYTDFKGIELAFVSKLILWEIRQPGDDTVQYVLKFKNIGQDDSQLEKSFTLHDGYYFIRIHIFKDREWHIGPISKGHYFR